MVNGSYTFLTSLHFGDSFQFKESGKGKMMRMKACGRWTIAGIGAAIASASLFAAAPLEPTVSEPRPSPKTAQDLPDYAPAPAIWKFSDSDTTIYLFGTIHALPQNFKWRNAKVNDVIARADEIVFESRTGESLDSDEILNNTMRRVFNYSRPPVLERVEPANRDLLKTSLKTQRLPMFLADAMPSWYTAFSIGPKDAFSSPSLSAFGCERVLQREFQRMGKPIGNLENGMDVFLTLSAVDERAQNLMLNNSLTRIRRAEQGESIATPVRVRNLRWATGQLDDSIIEELRALTGPGMYKALIVDRNEAWTGRLLQRLAQPGTVMVAIGTAHLYGQHSLQAMLARRGIKVRRIQ